MSFIVAIDGPTSSGKSTVSNFIAQKLNFEYIQTGAMYRCVALGLLQNNIQLNDEAKIKKMLNNMNIKFLNDRENQIVIMNNKDVTEKIRTKEVTDYTSKVASIILVRHKMLEIQRRMGQNSNVIMEGRDVGTNVFPNANVKFFLTAKPSIRARRKQRELEKIGEKLEFSSVLDSIYKWDKDAIERKEGALKRAKDSIYIDSSEMSIKELEEKMIDIIKQKYKEKDNYGWEK